MDIVFTFSNNILTIYINDESSLFNLTELGYNVNTPVGRGVIANHLIKDEIIKVIKKRVTSHLSFFQRVFSNKKVLIGSDRELSNLAAKQYMDLAESVLDNVVYIRVCIDPNIGNRVSENPLYMTKINNSQFIAERRNSKDVYRNKDASIANSTVTHTT